MATLFKGEDAQRKYGNRAGTAHPFSRDSESEPASIRPLRAQNEDAHHQVGMFSSRAFFAAGLELPEEVTVHHPFMNARDPQVARKTVMTEVKVNLPDSLAREASKVGLLKPKAIEKLLREEIRRRAVNELFGAMDRMAAVEGPPMTEDEIQAEIDAVRAARRARRR